MLALNCTSCTLHCKTKKAHIQTKNKRFSERKSWSRGIVSALPTVHVVVAPPCNEVWGTASMVKFFFPNSLVAIPEPARRRKQLQKRKMLMTAAPHSACQLDCDGFLVNRAGTFVHWFIILKLLRVFWVVGTLRCQETKNILILWKHGSNVSSFC